MGKTLFVLLGPTAVGKTKLSIDLARHLQTEIISCDSRQIFRETPIGTAMPSAEELSAVKHHFIATLSVHDYYSCGKFEMDALRVLNEIFALRPFALMTGGSMLYIDALCNGIDEIPDVDDELRASLNRRFVEEGIEGMRAELKLLDPEYYEKIDPKNHKRIIHALEVCLNAGKPYSAIRKESVKQRDFKIIKIGLLLPREELYERINQRVDVMVEAGLVEEARSLYPYRYLNALNTVGYKELFKYFDGEWTLSQAINMIKQNTRHYAKKQISWFGRDPDINWFSPAQRDDIFALVDSIRV